MNAPQAADTHLVFHVLQYLPGTTGAELEHRVKLLKARDWGAALRGRTTSDRAYALACEAHEIAGDMVFAEGQSCERLEAAVRLCRHLVGAAMNAELFEDLEATI